ncbi:MAG: hypothetical protein WB660_25170 [Candidatus Sulfotelmatobacter sp.]
MHCRIGISRHNRVVTVAPVGDIHTFSEPDVTTIFTEEELVLLAFEYAGNVTVAGLGTVEGAT